MSKRATMNFKEVNIDNYLYSGILVRFQDTDPSEFEDFIAYLLQKIGYEKVHTSYSADFGADLIVKKDGIKIAVQVKRYFELHKVGISDIKQVIGAQQYYRCGQSLMITTSSYTAPAKELARSANVILWDWDRLQQAISDVFLDGQRHQDYFKAYPADISKIDTDLFKLEVMNIDTPTSSPATRSSISMRLTNQTEEHKKITCELPTLLTDGDLQYTALQFGEESFSTGIVYGNATVEIIVEFSQRQLSDYHRKDRILLPIHLLQSQEILVLEKKLGQVKQECFLVSFYFGRDSREYEQMILFRDDILMRSYLGRAMVHAYYFGGSRLVSILEEKPSVIQVLKPIVRAIISMAGMTVGKKSR